MPSDKFMLTKHCRLPSTSLCSSANNAVAQGFHLLSHYLDPTWSAILCWQNRRPRTVWDLNRRVWVTERRQLCVCVVCATQSSHFETVKRQKSVGDEGMLRSDRWMIWLFPFRKNGITCKWWKTLLTAFFNLSWHWWVNIITSTKQLAQISP